MRHPQNEARNTEYPAIMRLRTVPAAATVGLMTFLVFLAWPPIGSCHPMAKPEQHRMVLMERLSSPGFRFGWRNVTCRMCKIVFGVVDLALAVMFARFVCLLVYEH